MRYLRFSDLVERGIVNNRQCLYKWIRNNGFPPGIKIAPNTRVWPEDEVERWIAERRETAA